MSYNFGVPMEWDVFKKMPERIQAEYITNLQKKYGATARDISAMFGIKPLTVYRHVTSRNLDVAFPKGRSMSDEQRIIWNDFLGGCQEAPDAGDAAIQEADSSDACAVEAPDPAVPEAEDVCCCDAKASVFDIAPAILQGSSPADKTRMQMKELSLFFSGPIDVDAVSNSLKMILGSSASGSLEVICHLD